jgi:hypothetical protein
MDIGGRIPLLLDARAPPADAMSFPKKSLPYPADHGSYRVQRVSPVSDFPCLNPNRTRSSMKTKLFRSLAAAWLFLAAPAAFAQITVGNVRAAQRVGTKLVDIDYDLTGLATPCYVWLDISGDGGSTWAVAATTLTGAVGANVTPGTNLRITWNAGVDWNGVMSPQTRFRIRASDGLPDLENFAAIPAGSFQMGDALDGLPDAPVHTVNVSEFYMQKKGVTKAEWDAVRA